MSLPVARVALATPKASGAKQPLWRGRGGVQGQARLGSKLRPSCSTRAPAPHHFPALLFWHGLTFTVISVPTLQVSAPSLSPLWCPQGARGPVQPCAHPSQPPKAGMAELAWEKDIDPFSGLQSAGPWHNFLPPTTTVSAWEPSQTRFGPIKAAGDCAQLGVGMAAPSSGLWWQEGDWAEGGLHATERTQPGEGGASGWGCNALAANVLHRCSSSSKNRQAQVSLNLVPNPQLWHRKVQICSKAGSSSFWSHSRGYWRSPGWVSGCSFQPGWHYLHHSDLFMQMGFHPRKHLGLLWCFGGDLVRVHRFMTVGKHKSRAAGQVRLWL